MSMKHTPGPWKAGTTVSDDSGRPVAKVNFKHQPTHWANGNARLIAAAPELLAALQLASVELANMRAGLKPLVGDLQRADVAVRAAIAKATGQ